MKVRTHDWFTVMMAGLITLTIAPHSTRAETIEEFSQKLKAADFLMVFFPQQIGQQIKYRILSCYGTGNLDEMKNAAARSTPDSFVRTFANAPILFVHGPGINTYTYCFSGESMGFFEKEKKTAEIRYRDFDSYVEGLNSKKLSRPYHFVTWPDLVPKNILIGKTGSRTIVADEQRFRHAIDLLEKGSDSFKEIPLK